MTNNVTSILYKEEAIQMQERRQHRSPERRVTHASFAPFMSWKMQSRHRAETLDNFVPGRKAAHFSDVYTFQRKQVVNALKDMMTTSLICET